MIDLLAALILAGGPTSGGCGFEDPSVPGGWVATDCPPDVEPVPQLPDEDEGRQLDCPDGQVGTVHSHVLICPPPANNPPVPAIIEHEQPGVEPAPIVDAPVVPRSAPRTSTPAPRSSTAAPAPTPMVAPTPMPGRLIDLLHRLFGFAW